MDGMVIYLAADASLKVLFPIHGRNSRTNLYSYVNNYENTNESLESLKPTHCAQARLYQIVDDSHFYFQPLRDVMFALWIQVHNLSYEV